MTELTRATAFAPASIGNLGVGFDVLGLAIAGAGDRVSVARRDEEGIEIESITDSGGAPITGLATDWDKNTASIAAAALWSEYGGDGGLLMQIEKGVPLQSGMGSSAASAVAGVVAANELLESPLPLASLLPYAIEGEAFASGGRHADNVAPSLLGGLALCVPGRDAIRISTPDGVSSVLLHPELRVNTAESRRGLAASVSRGQWVEQQAYLAGFVAACFQGDIEGMRATLRDIIIEPQRAASVSCFAGVSSVARDFGVIGCSLSGSGPSIFALVEDERAPELASLMEAECRSQDIDCQLWISSLTSPGSRVEV